MVERFDLVGADRMPLGRTAERGSQLSDGEYHVVVMALMVNPEGKILVTKRSHNKTAPGKWECTAGSVVAGETSRNAMIREIKEEIGIDVSIPAGAPMGTFLEEDAIFDIWEVPVTNNLQDLLLQTDEVAEARYMTVEEIEWIIESDQATRSLREILTILKRRSGSIVLE